MILNSTIIKKIFLPLTFISLALVAGEPSAKAEVPNSIEAQSSIANPILRATKAKKPTGSQRVPQRVPQRVNSYRIALAPKASALQATPGNVMTRGATLLGQPSISSSNRVAINAKRNPASTAATTSTFTSGSNVRLAQSTQPRLRKRAGAAKLAQTSPSDPSTGVPGRADPSSTPSGTPTNPANVTPGTTTPGTTTPGTTTPGTTTPDTTSPLNTTPTAPSTTPGTTTPETTPGTTTPETAPSNTVPTTPSTTPGTTTPETTPGTTTPETTPGTTTPDTTQPASPTEISPGRGTRSGSSYIGVGGNIGIGSGDTALGEGSFAVISKIGLTRQFSVRPSVLFTDDVTILIPVTFDFSFGEGPTDELSFAAAPYLGIGAAISTGDGADVGLLLTGGIDVPLSPQFTATASVNASVTGESAVGVLLGVGYNFTGF
jgi:hypothetical protein